MVFADALSTVSAVSAVIAIAALVTSPARRWPRLERDGRERDRHTEEMTRMRDAADATIAEEMSAM